MSSNLVIVAIPAKDEKVWKVSSEQVPHLTLLFLGENTGDVAKLEQIVEFVDHAVKVEEHGPVMLSVDERGTLGPDEADVLFFEKDYSIKWLSHFRNQLLQQNDIRAAYESVPQYPEWRPHLTLGYPATPANEDEIPEHGLNWISFDRIAVWTEDFNGPEFKLRWPDRSQEEPCMAMANTNEARKALGLDALVEELVPIEHHGVKGMRWGVRQHREGVLRKQSDSLRTKADKTQNAKLGKQRVKDARASRLNKQADRKQAQADHLNRNIQKTGQIRGKIGSGLRRVGKAFNGAMTALADSHWQGSTYSDVKHEAVHNHVAEKLDNHIGRLQNSPKYRGKNLKADSNLRKTYYEDVAKVTESQYRQGVKEVYGQNYTGTKSAHYVTDARGPRIEVRDTKTGEKHSESPLTSMSEIRKIRAQNAMLAQSATAIDAPDISIDLVLDDNGQISGVGFINTEADKMAQTANLGAEFIAHHGVKGMHWGVQKERFQSNLHQRRVTTEAANRARRPAKGVVAYPTIGSSKRTPSKIDAKGGEDHPPTHDAIKVAVARQKLKKSGVHALTNDELRDVANRLNLEQQVSQLESRNRTKSLGRQFIDGIIGNKKNQQKVTDFASKQVIKRAVPGVGALL